jgi:murein L,D-transpeptidase YafK
MTVAEMQERKLRVERPLFIRVFKEESELEVWKLADDGRYQHFRTYPICTWSGALGPKLFEGDKQSPEGFYLVSRDRMNPHSKFHLAFNLGFPNAYDSSHGRTGTALMVHGKCSSAGCYAITDAYVEEVYALAREAFIGGQESIPVHIFPFRMTADNIARHKASPHMLFWTMLLAGYDAFERTQTVPTIAVCDRRYVVNPIWRAPLTKPLDSTQRCPAYETSEAPSAAPLALHGRVLPGRRLRSQVGAQL